MNIIEMIQGKLGGSVMDKIGETCGISPEEARTATGAAVPTLLAGMTHLASTPDGARKLDATVDAADDSFASNPMSALSRLGSGGEESSNPISSLFGGNMMSGLSSGLAKFTGLGSGRIMSIVAMLGPMLLGMLKGQKKTMGLDSSGLSSLLLSQRQNISNAMPAGLSGVLSSIPGMSSLTNLGGRASDAGAAVVERARDAASGTYGRTKEYADDAYDSTRHAAHAAGSSAGRWMIPALAVLALIGLLWWFSSRPSSTAPTAMKPPPPAPVAQAPVGQAPNAPAQPENTDEAQVASAAIPGGMSLTDQVSHFTKSATETLTQVKDASSAESAVPKLKELSTSLDKIATATDSLSQSGRSTIVDTLKTTKTSLQSVADKAMAIPGVSDKIKPTVDELMTKINTITGETTPAPSGT